MITDDTKEIDSIVAENLGKISELCQRLTAIIGNASASPEPAWLEALKQDGTALHAELCELLGIGIAGESPVEEAVSFMCDQIEKTFERLSAWKSRGCPAGEI